MLSIIIPAYDEAERIGASLRSIGAFLAERAEPSEIVVVDDGSRDSTAAVVAAVAQTLSVPVRIARYERNRGKGHALKVGFALSSGDRIVFSDADLSTPIRMVDLLLAPLDECYDIAIGSRKMAGAELVVRQPWHRELLGRVFTRLVQLLAAPVSDATCGFKAFRGDVGRDLFARVRRDGWSFDAELLVIARQRGYRVTEVPVAWEHRAGTKVNLLRDVVGSLVGLASIRMDAFLGRYRTLAALDEPHEATNVGAGSLSTRGEGADATADSAT